MASCNNKFACLDLRNSCEMIVDSEDQEITLMKRVVHDSEGPSVGDITSTCAAFGKPAEMQRAVDAEDDCACSSHSDSDASVRTKSANGGSLPLNPCRHIVNTVLSSVWVAMQTKPADLVADQLAKKVSASAIKNAKHELWTNADQKIIGRWKKRRATSERPESLAHAKDIVIALNKLDAQSSMPFIAVNALDIQRIPVLFDEPNPDPEHRPVSQSGNDIRLRSLERTCEELKVLLSKLSADFQLVRTTVSVSQNDNTLVKQPVSQTDSTSDLMPVSESDGTLDKQPVSFAGVASKLDGADQDWSVAQAKKKKRVKQRRHVTGSVSTDKVKAAPNTVETSRDIFVYWVDKETTTEDMQEYIRNDLGITPRNFQCVSNPNAPRKSFKLTVSAKEVEPLLDATKWPLGIRVRRFYSKKNIEISTTAD